MTPEQKARIDALKTLNFRRLQREAVEQALSEAGFHPVMVADDRVERLLAALRRSSPVDALLEDHNWQRTVTRFVDGRFGVTIGPLWDWEGTNPPYRFAAVSLLSRIDQLSLLYPSGLWLVDDNDRDALVVDFEMNEDAGLVVARLRELRLADAEN